MRARARIRQVGVIRGAFKEKFAKVTIYRLRATAVEAMPEDFHCRSVAEANEHQ